MSHSRKVDAWLVKHGITNVEIKRAIKEMILKSYKLGMHILCVKPIATTQSEFRQIILAHKAHSDLMLVQGQNKRWNPAASRMREWLREEGGIGEMLGGECRFWIRQNLRTGPDSRHADAFVEGLSFHTGTSYQLDQLVAAKGLPKHVTAHIHRRQDPNLGQAGFGELLAGMR